MARFDNNEWKAIFDLLDGADDAQVQYGLPRRRDKSIILSSFNIRALASSDVIPPDGRGGRTAGAWKFIANYADHCDLLAIQEVGDNLAGIRKLKESLAEPDKYGLVVTDATGGRPGKQAHVERLAFLFRWDRVARTELASDITYDRSEVLESIFDQRFVYMEDFESHAAELAAWREAFRVKEYYKKKGKLDIGKVTKGAKPAFVLRNFLTFIRSPQCVSFRVPGAAGADPYEFLAVNAHLLYGDGSRQKEERRMEFQALMRWLIARADKDETLYHRNILLFGDLNLDFDEADEDRRRIEADIRAINREVLHKAESSKLNMPFLDVHHGEEEPYRSTARMTQTYDQIALLINDPRLPHSQRNKVAGTEGADGYDYGVFQFTNLFTNALHDGKDFAQLTKPRKQKLVARFEHDVSDHLPIWIRLPIPEA